MTDPRDHVLYNDTPPPSGTDHAVGAGNPGVEARADTVEHGRELTEPAAGTGSGYLLAFKRWMDASAGIFVALDACTPDERDRRIRHFRDGLRAVDSEIDEMEGRATPARKEPV